METESGETFSHDRLRFTVLRQGTKEVALETDEPGLPWRLGLTINYESKELVLRYGSSYQGANVQSTFEGKKFELGLTKGGKLSLYDAAQGLFLLTGLVPSGLQLRVDEKVVEFTEKLSLIQRKTGLALHMPAKFEDGDWTLVSRAAEVVQNGYLGLRPPTITLRWGRDEIEHAIALFENQPDASFRILEDEVVELFGVRIPLGRVVRVVEGYQPDPASLEAVRAQLSQGDAVGPLELQLSGGEGATLHQLYERWLSAEDRARIPEDVFPSVPA
jgi:hypothetical protein